MYQRCPTIRMMGWPYPVHHVFFLASIDRQIRGDQTYKQNIYYNNYTVYNIQLYHVATLVVSISISSRPWLPWHAMTIFQLQRFCAKPWGRQVTVHLMKLWEPFCSMCRSICRHFLEGKCNYGDQCRFSHEVHELLAPDPVQAVSQGRGSTLFQCWKQESCTVP